MKATGKKMGRPTEAPKRDLIQIRLSEEDKRILDTCAEAAGKPKAEIVREGIREVYKKLNLK